MMSAAPVFEHSDLASRVAAGEIRALSRAITLVENGIADSEVFRLEGTPTDNAPVIGITGPPGVGKSTLISACIAHLRQQDARVAVVSVDPSSPFNGGAILGDRLRMDAHAADPGVFIRSVAARGHLGGLSRNTADIVSVVRLAGWDYILLETVGTGQSEVEIVGIADVCVVVSCPGMGDEIQAMKSGVLDIADVLVVNKADLPGADQTSRGLRGMLKLREESRQAIPVIETVATQGTGIAELANAFSAQLERAA